MDGRELGVSQPTVAERMRRTEERGVVRGAMLRLDHAKLGDPIEAFIRVVATPSVQDRLEEVARAIPQVVETSRVTGEDCLIVRAVLRSVGERSEVIGQRSHYGASNTSIVLGTPIPLRSPLAPAGPPGRAARRGLRYSADTLTDPGAPMAIVRPVVLAAALAAAPAVVAAQDLPSRKPGLWEVTMQVTNAPSQTVRQCIDEKTDAQMQRMAQGMGQQQCSKNTLTRDGDRWVGESECRFGGSTATSRSVFAGDFDKAYKGEVDTKYSPPMGGVSQSKVTMQAKWAGPCPSGWKPGDMEMPGGMGRVNVNEMMGGGAAAKAPRK